MIMGRTTKIIGFSVPPTMVKEIEEVAKEESRTKSELFREMFRVYKRYRTKQETAQDNWVMDIVKQAKEEQRTTPATQTALLMESEKLAQYGSKRAEDIGIQEEKINDLIYGYRKQGKSS